MNSLKDKIQTRCKRGKYKQAKSLDNRCRPDLDILIDRAYRENRGKKLSVAEIVKSTGINRSTIDYIINKALEKIMPAMSDWQ